MAGNTSLRICDIIRVKELQGREEHSSDHQSDIAEHLKRGGKLKNRPKVMRVTDRDDKLYAVDGFHTIGAYEDNGRSTIPVELFVGTWQDARDMATEANARHIGLKRSRKDKNRVVRMTLEDHPDWSDVAVAKHCHVSPQLAKDVRQTIPAAKAATTRVGIDNKRRTAKPQRATPKPTEAAEPERNGKPRAAKLDWEKHDSVMKWLNGFIEAAQSLTGNREDADEARALFSAYLDNHASHWRKQLS